MSEQLNKTLKQEAISLGLCRKWQREWGDCSEYELIDKYKRGIDFCIKNQYPTNEFIKENFNSDLLHENLIFVDEYINISDSPSGVYILNGECTGTLCFSEFAVATLYVRHSSNINILAGEFAKIFVRLYDDAEADVVEIENAEVRVYERR